MLLASMYSVPSVDRTIIVKEISWESAYNKFVLKNNIIIKENIIFKYIDYF